MANTTNITRRKFLKQSITAGTVFSIVPSFVLGRNKVAPSDKITLGIIGVGKQTRGLINRFMAEPNTQIVAGCDVFASKRDWFINYVAQKYAEERNEPSFSGLKTYLEYEELLERSDIDAVLVVTPDHWHAIPSIKAMEKGKDVYCEKPLAHTIKEGRAMVKAAQKYNRVLQTGSMQRSWEKFRKAVELVINGYVGEIKQVLVNVGDPAIPCDLLPEVMPKNVDWDRWCGPAAYRSYHSTLAPMEVEGTPWANWRDYQEFGGGILSDWGAHMFDIAQWGLEMDHTGPIKFIAPQEKDAKRGLKMIYANGIEMIHQDFERGWGVRFIGTEGSLDISRKFLDSKPESIVTATIKNGEKRVYKSENHYKDWLDAIINRTKPICDVEIGHRSASICNLANIAYDIGGTIEWGPEKEKFVGNGAANKMRTKKYRKPYKF